MNRGWERGGCGAEAFGDPSIGGTSFITGNNGFPFFEFVAIAYCNHATLIIFIL